MNSLKRVLIHDYYNTRYIENEFLIHSLSTAVRRGAESRLSTRLLITIELGVLAFCFLHRQTKVRNRSMFRKRAKSSLLRPKVKKKLEEVKNRRRFYSFDRKLEDIASLFRYRAMDREEGGAGESPSGMLMKFFDVERVRNG